MLGGYGWIGLKKIIRSFSDDLNISDHCILRQSVGKELFSTHVLRVVENALDSLKDVANEILRCQVFLAHRRAASERTFSRNLR